MREILERKTMEAITSHFGEYGVWLEDPGEERCKVIARDDLDKSYVIVLQHDFTPPIDEWKKRNICITSIKAPIAGVVQIGVVKMWPTPYALAGCTSTCQPWFQELREYFKKTIGTDFNIWENPLFDTVDTSHMKYSDEGDELGWVQEESNAYIGSTFHFETEHYMYDSTKFEESRDFVLRKLEDIFGNKYKARFKKVQKDNDRSIYRFTISTF